MERMPVQSLVALLRPFADKRNGNEFFVAIENHSIIVSRITEVAVTEIELPETLD